MDKRSQIVLVLGLAITIILLFISIYLAGIAFVLFITLFMSLQIMQDSISRPDVAASLSEDAKSIILKNSGNATALHIHAALVPMDVEYDVPSLLVDESHSRLLDSMVQNVKIVLTYENEEKVVFSKSFALSALGNEYEPFKPMFPLFQWK
ncbi:MAG: hypothetical protein CVV30_11250 [Methanomicrobiales archaeon HGW-Methanomicrobiales-1]|jgi:hypothetical protein|nr:MAG: hypothetical protein CVV30_11250 [Methanomicrobiales archaeon HGW-Methanomicrobiales-1]